MVRLNSIQVLRAVAALGVVALHCAISWQDAVGQKYPAVLRLGAFGVDLFFAISGYIICSTAKSSPSAADFLRKRFVRVAPVYYIQTAAFAPISLATGKFTLAALATSLLFWPVWGPEPTTPLLKVGWTLGFEMLFYTSFAAAMRFGARATAVLLAAYVGATALNVAGAGGVTQFVGSPLLAEFLFGALIALAAGPKSPAKGAAAVLLAGAVLALPTARGFGAAWAGWPVLHPDVAFMRLMCAGLPCAILVWGALQLEPWCRGRFMAVLGYLGDASYSIYLSHILVLALVVGAWRWTGAPAIAMPFVEFVCGVGAGVLAFELVEKPLLARLREPRKVRRSLTSSLETQG